MRNLRSHLIGIALTVILLSGCSVFTQTPEPPNPTVLTPMRSNEVQLKVSSIEIRAAQPQAADLRKIRHINEAKDRSAEDIVYIVKLYMDDVEPLYSSLGVSLFVGDNQIEEYSGFKNGVYFKIYDPDFLTENAGEKVQFTIDGQEFVDTGVRFPDFSVDTQPADEAATATGLPSQEQVLSE